MSNPSFAPLSPDRNLMKRRTKLTWHGDKYYTFVTQNLKDLTVYLLYVCCKTFVYTDIFREFSHQISQVKMQHFLNVIHAVMQFRMWIANLHEICIVTVFHSNSLDNNNNSLFSFQCQFYEWISVQSCPVGLQTLGRQVWGKTSTLNKN